MPRQRIFSPAIAGTAHCCFCSSVPNARIGGIAMSVCTPTPIARPAVGAVVELLAEDQLAQEVAALPAVLLGLVQAEEAALAHAREHRVREGRGLPLVDVRRELRRHEAPDRRPQILVLIREQVVAATGGVVRLQHGGRRHAGTLGCRARLARRLSGMTNRPRRSAGSAGDIARSGDARTRCCCAESTRASEERANVTQELSDFEALHAIRVGGLHASQAGQRRRARRARADLRHAGGLHADREGHAGARRAARAAARASSTSRPSARCTSASSPSTSRARASAPSGRTWPTTTSTAAS